ncbi:MAG: DPP IV N-terminal domain-containing protein [Candidatus Poribacteria bacterium]|nr:DPP IV N-terminal domain-containing protein [Candidatus Poribacteria bacterium]
MFKQILWITGVFILLISTLAHSKIVFTSTRDGILEIYVMNDDGSRIQRLTHNKLGEHNPVWSPDGEMIAFTRNLSPVFQDPQLDIFIMDADGRNQRNLTQHPARDDDATWSPDGRHIAFTSSRSGRNEIYTINIFSGKIKQLTHHKDNNAFGIKGIIVMGFPVDGFAYEPCWSPDGKYIVYNQYGIGQVGSINIIDVKTKQKKQLIQKIPHLSERHPRWSPDGKYILYHEENSKDAFANVDLNKPLFILDIIRLTTDRLVIVDVDGIEQPKLAIPEEWLVGSKTSWSPDSKEFVFSATPQRGVSSSDIFRYNLATHEIVNLTNRLKSDDNPNWLNRTLSVTPAGKIATQWGQIKK